MTIEVDGQAVGPTIQRDIDRDDLIVITGAGGFIAGTLTRYFHDLGLHPNPSCSTASRCPIGTSGCQAWSR